jgi:hypothetical protein
LDDGRSESNSERLRLWDDRTGSGIRGGALTEAVMSRARVETTRFLPPVRDVEEEIEDFRVEEGLTGGGFVRLETCGDGVFGAVLRRERAAERDGVRGQAGERERI